jgi:hypothetical protein
VVSVLANTQKELNKDAFKNNHMQKELLGRLKTMTREKMVVVAYAGTKLVPSLSTIYWEKSVVMQGGGCSRQAKTLIGEVNHTALVVDLDLTLQHKWTSSGFYPEEDITEMESYL